MKSVFRSTFAILALTTAPAAAQSSGSIVGRVVDAQTQAPLAGVDVRVIGLTQRTLSGADGRFVLGSVPPGERDVRAERIGYHPQMMQRVPVRTARAAEIRIELQPSAVPLPSVVVRADRVRLVEPEISTTHEVVVAREIRELPVDRIDQIIELTTGVSEGHFRGGRVGQEVYVIDGLSLKNQFDASTAGFLLELSPTSLEEVDVITGGFGAAYGAALSGVVSYVTRRGSPDAWDGRASFSTDHWTPTALLRGFTGFGASAGGPVSFLGKGTTLFADLLLQGFLDSEPRAAGLACLEPGDADEALAEQIRALQDNPQTAPLYCPYSKDMLPHQRGDKYIAFARVDKPLSANLNFTGSLLRNRTQRELYTQAFKYNSDYQLGQRSAGSLLNLSAEYLQQRSTSARSVVARVAAMRLDRYLGVIEPGSFDDRINVLGFSPTPFEFIGEDYVRRPIEEQLASGSAVPGYIAPGGNSGSPFGVAGEGIFFTDGTPTLANWTRSDLISSDLVASYFNPAGSSYRAGLSSKFYRIETYQRALAHLAGSIPNYARFYPGIQSAFAEGDITTESGIRFQLGLRFEAFRSGIDFRFDRADFTAPIIETGWKMSVLPRLGATFPFPGSDGTVFRFNFGRVAQPPDFQYFLDSTIGDSLRTDVRRQGNPDMAFEKGMSYEVGASQLITENFAIGVTAFRKKLENLVSGTLVAGDVGSSGQYSTSDYGSVTGLEFSARGRWPLVTVRAGWALQKAVGLTSGIEDDTAVVPIEVVDEYPLAFDRRHSIDLSLLLGRAAGAELPWAISIANTTQSGYPLFRPPGDSARFSRDPQRYLPWNWTTDMRGSWEFTSLPVCRECRWRAYVDGRNILNRMNVTALRRETGTIAPTLADVNALARRVAAPAQPIPRESPGYIRLADLNRDGLITADEFRTARFAAALDRYDPSLYYGEALQLRLGVEIVF